MRVRWIVLPFVAMVFLCLFGVLLRGRQVAPEVYADRGSQQTVYAYRDWQSTIYTLNPGDSVRIAATGSWMYSPEVGLHGPEGSRYHMAPESYPVPYAPGGILLGRIGENGQPFVVGRGTFDTAQENGKLYLRINDDRLGDNEGELAVEMEIEWASGVHTNNLPDVLPVTTPDARPVATPAW